MRHTVGRAHLRIVPMTRPPAVDADATEAPHTEAHDAARRRAMVRVGLAVAALTVVADQLTKQLALWFLEPGEMVDVLVDGWGLDLTFNPGGAFSVPAPSWFFLAVTVIVVWLVARNLPHAPTRLQATAWGLLLAGGLGNAIDRVFRAGDPGDPTWFHGHVVDFIAWGSFPRFNVADSAITIGFVLLVGSLWRHDEGRVGAP